MTDSPNKITMEQIDKLFAIFREEDRLKKLTNRELVDAVCATDHADNLLVLEMMRRLDPDWSSSVRMQELEPIPLPTKDAEDTR